MVLPLIYIGRCSITPTRRRHDAEPEGAGIMENDAAKLGRELRLLSAHGQPFALASMGLYRHFRLAMSGRRRETVVINCSIYRCPQQVGAVSRP